MSKGIQKVSTLNDRQSGGRRLAALMFTDMVGYSTLTAKDEVLSLQLVAEQQAIIKSLFPRFGGVRMRTIGDGCFMEFGSAIESVLCAREIQTRIRDRNAAAPSDQQIQLRIGIHLGDIIDFDGDSYGDGVNIAARIETQANPGGIFLTRQVHDQVVGNIPDRLIGVGKVELKNIPKPVEVYRVEMPWESKSLKASWLRSIKKAWFFSEGRQPKQSIWRRTVFGFLGVMVFGILATTCFSIWTNMVVQEAPNEVIKGAWEYSVIDQNGAVGPWNEFKVSHRYTYADAIKGNYWLRTKFKLEHPYESPSLVIGQLPQGSSLYLNGRFIGTGNQFGIVQSFFIQKDHLNQTEENEILLKSPPPAMGRLGFYVIPEIGIRIGESEFINNRTLQREYRYYSLKASYLLMSVVMIFIFLVFMIQGKNTSQAVYGASFFVLLTLGLIYYNAALTSRMMETTKILIKNIALTGQCFVLFSGFLSAKRKSKIEPWNNVLAILMLSAQVGFMFFAHPNLAETLMYQHLALHFCFAYTALWLSYAVLSTITWKNEMVFKRKPWVGGMAERSAPIILAFFTFVLVWTSFRNGYSPFAIQEPMRENLRDTAQNIQFSLGVFGVMGVFVAYLVTTGRLGNVKKRDDLMLKVARLIGATPDPKESLGQVQEMLAQFVGAERSSVYLLSKESGKLVSLSVQATPDVATQIHRSIESKEGPLGYVWESRTPILIQNIEEDERFRKYISEREGLSTFKTGACMILPLMVGGDLVGIMTLADPKESKAFSKADFFLMQMVAGDLALLLKGFDLRGTLTLAYSA